MTKPHIADAGVLAHAPTARTNTAGATVANSGGMSRVTVPEPTCVAMVSISTTLFSVAAVYSQITRSRRPHLHKQLLFLKTRAASFSLWATPAT